jgi:hypothetical protein
MKIGHLIEVAGVLYQGAAMVPACRTLKSPAACRNAMPKLLLAKKAIASLHV